MAISRADFCSFITELVTRNPAMGIPALENGLFATCWFSIIYICFMIFENLFVKVRERKGSVPYLFSALSIFCLARVWGTLYTAAPI